MTDFIHTSFIEIFQGKHAVSEDHLVLSARPAWSIALSQPPDTRIKPERRGSACLGEKICSPTKILEVPDKRTSQSNQEEIESTGATPTLRLPDLD
jgi:hypothetical protein